MAEKSSFFTSLNGDRRYKASDFAEYFKTFIGNGVFPNPSTNLQVVANGDMTLTLSPGYAWLNGYMYSNTDDLVLTIDHADSALKRIDRVVIRCDYVNREIRSYVKKGIFSTNPMVPNLERGANAYEISVADIKVDNGIINISQSDITDTRLNSGLCGIVTQTVETIDTTTLFNQIEAYRQEFESNLEVWRAQEEQDQETWFNNTSNQLLTDFNTWFETIKDALDGDVAGNLLNEINKLKETINNMELTSSNVKRPDGSTVEAALSEHKTSIKNAKIDIENLQNEVSGVRVNLYNNLTSLGVVTNENDSLSTLSSKVNELYGTNSKIDINNIGRFRELNFCNNFTNNIPTYRAYAKTHNVHYKDYWYHLDSNQKILKIDIRTNTIISELAMSQNWTSTNVHRIKVIDNIMYFCSYKSATDNRIRIGRLNLDTETQLSTISITVSNSDVQDYNTYTIEKINSSLYLIFDLSNYSYGLKVSESGTVQSTVKFNSNYIGRDDSFVKDNIIYATSGVALSKIDANLNLIVKASTPGKSYYDRLEHNGVGFYGVGHISSYPAPKQPLVHKWNYHFVKEQEFIGELSPSQTISFSDPNMYATDKFLALYYDRLYILGSELELWGKTEYDTNVHEMGTPYIFADDTIFVGNHYNQKHTDKTIYASTHKFEEYYKILK